jgi:hypothetical protein
MARCLCRAAPGTPLSLAGIIVMDNLSHRIAGVQPAIYAKGAELIYLPPYSSDLNPIEPLFAKLNALLRKAAERSISALWTRIGELLDQFSADECRHYLAHAGYVRSENALECPLLMTILITARKELPWRS